MKQTAFSLITLLLGIVWYACEKDPMEFSRPESNIPVAAQSRSDQNGYVQTLLGEARNNPYTVENMTLAWNSLYPEHSYTQLPATHQYIKFSPASMDELVVIIENELDHFDFPVEYEVLQEGDYYIAPGKSIEELPELYAVVPAGFQMPDSITSYEVLENLVLPPESSFLTARAFTQLGLNYGHGGGGEYPSECHEGCELFPYCLVCEEIGCSSEDFTTIGLPNCMPGLPGWPACLEEECDDPPHPHLLVGIVASVFGAIPGRSAVVYKLMTPNWDWRRFGE